jgi:hypothetical protein
MKNKQWNPTVDINRNDSKFSFTELKDFSSIKFPVHPGNMR